MTKEIKVELKRLNGKVFRFIQEWVGRNVKIYYLRVGGEVLGTVGVFVLRRLDGEPVKTATEAFTREVLHVERPVVVRAVSILGAGDRFSRKEGRTKIVDRIARTLLSRHSIEPVREKEGGKPSDIIMYGARKVAERKYGFPLSYKGAWDAELTELEAKFFPPAWLENKECR